MAHILILEDDIESNIALKEILSHVETDMTVDTATDLATARSLLDSTVSFDLFLLDVNLDKHNQEDSSGLIFAKEIRDIIKYEFTPIVMITSVASLEIEAYRKIHCYQYILKPYEAKEVKDLVRKVLSHLRAEEKPYIVVKKDGINYKILCEEIVYCKAVPRGVCLCMREEQMEVPYLSIRQLLEKLPKKGFFQCHRMFLVNQTYVQSYDLVNQMIRVEGYKEELDIGVTYKTEVRRLLYE